MIYYGVPTGYKYNTYKAVKPRESNQSDVSILMSTNMYEHDNAESLDTLIGQTSIDHLKFGIVNLNVIFD